MSDEIPAIEVDFDKEAAAAAAAGITDESIRDGVRGQIADIEARIAANEAEHASLAEELAVAQQRLADLGG